MRVGSPRLVLRVVFLALAASLLLSAGAPAASLPDYRCCFRVDALMTGSSTPSTTTLPGKPSDDERASFTFMTSELLVYSVTGGRPHLRRAFTRRGGPWPQTDGPGVAFGVGRVTTHTGGRVACDVEDSSRVYTSAPNLMNRFYKGARGSTSESRSGRELPTSAGKRTGRATRRNTASERALSTGSVRAGRRRTCSSRPRALSSRRSRRRSFRACAGSARTSSTTRSSAP